MLCPFQIRPMDQIYSERAQRAERDAEQGDEEYARLCRELEDADRAEYEEEFGEVYRARHPFKANSASIHQRAVAMMACDA